MSLLNTFVKSFMEAVLEEDDNRVSGLLNKLNLLTMDPKKSNRLLAELLGAVRVTAKPQYIGFLLDYWDETIPDDVFKAWTQILMERSTALETIKYCLMAKEQVVDALGEVLLEIIEKDIANYNNVVQFDRIISIYGGLDRDDAMVLLEHCQTPNNKGEVAETYIPFFQEIVDMTNPMAEKPDWVKNYSDTILMKNSDLIDSLAIRYGKARSYYLAKIEEKRQRRIYKDMMEEHEELLKKERNSTEQDDNEIQSRKDRLDFYRASMEDPDIDWSKEPQDSTDALIKKQLESIDDLKNKERERRKAFNELEEPDKTGGDILVGGRFEENIADELLSHMRNLGITASEEDAAQKVIMDLVNRAELSEIKDMIAPHLRNDEVELMEKDLQIFRALGPSHALLGDPLNHDNICSRYGPCRMLTCTHFEGTEEYGEYLPGTLDTMGDWFTGNCETCHNRIEKACYAVRIPYDEGGWGGCFCSWDCVRNTTDRTITTFTYRLIQEFESQVSINGIQERTY